jgi:hypothetical protein
MKELILYQNNDQDKPLTFYSLNDVKLFLLRNREIADGIASPCGTAILHLDPDGTWKVYEFYAQYLAFNFCPLTTEEWIEFEGESYLDNIKHFIEIIQDDIC